MPLLARPAGHPVALAAIGTLRSVGMRPLVSGLDTPLTPGPLLTAYPHVVCLPPLLFRFALQGGFAQHT